jgi:primosomal protein N'
MHHTDTHCHCGAHRKGSDHCPECGCEEFETVCSHVHGVQSVEDWMTAEPPPVRMDEETGWIFLGSDRLSQDEAMKVALRLAEAVEGSIWRTQKSQPWFNDMIWILRRSESSLGQAIAALRRAQFDR